MAVGSEELRWEEGKAIPKAERPPLASPWVGNSYFSVQAVVFDAPLLNQTPRGGFVKPFSALSLCVCVCRPASTFT